MANTDIGLFKEAMGRFASGVTVITTRTPEGQHHGMTASAFCSLSLDPPLILVCIQNGNASYDLIKTAGVFGVNLLAQEQESLSNRFAGGFINDEGQWTRWPEDRDKFEDLNFVTANGSGIALLEGCLAQLDCSLEEVLPGGDHGIFIGRVRKIIVNQDQVPNPLLYFKGRYKQLEDS